VTERPWSDADRHAMARALVLAELGRNTVRPNPMVGCVLVRDAKIVGEGWHERAGGPHAEIAALRAGGQAARGATAYVTLEPCDHTGRTGPCTTALREAGVAEVVYALDDPDAAAGGGAQSLRAAGIPVRSGLLAEWVETQNEVFLLTRRAKRPFLTLKLAQTLDGQLRTPRGVPWITGRTARTAVHRLRSESDAVLVGSQTVIDDDPALTVRHLDAPRGQPRAVVLDARGRIGLDAALVTQRGRTDADPPSLVLTSSAADAIWCRKLDDAGVEVVVLPAGPRGGVELAAVTGALLERGLHHVLVEGGETVAREFVSSGLIDRLVLHIALTIVGPFGLPSVTSAATAPDGPWCWATEKVGHLGRDLEVVVTPNLPACERAGTAGGREA